jgi:hypothetical protein
VGREYPKSREPRQSWSSIGTGHMVLDQCFIDSLNGRNKGNRSKTIEAQRLKVLRVVHEGGHLAEDLLV